MRGLTCHICLVCLTPHTIKTNRLLQSCIIEYAMHIITNNIIKNKNDRQKKYKSEI